MMLQATSLTSPAPRNKKVWSASFPPSNLKAERIPANTTDAVPCNRQKSPESENTVYQGKNNVLS